MGGPVRVLRFQRYIFVQIFWPVLGVLAGLCLMALLSQSLTQLDLILVKRQSFLALLWITVLSLPQVIALILPLALFFATVYALNRLLDDQELVVGYATGMSFFELAAPVLRVTFIAMLGHLALTTHLQPMAFREIRATFKAVAADVAAAIIRPGQFLEPVAGLTVYSRNTHQGSLEGVLIHDVRIPAEPVTFTAERARLFSLRGAPAFVLQDGEYQRRRQTGEIDFGSFERYSLELPELQPKGEFFVLKPSDRFLGEMFYPDRTYFYDQRQIPKLLAEGHFRLSSPLYDLALVAIAMAALLGGEFSRRGNRSRILIASALALLVRLGALGIQTIGIENPERNWLQYGVPLAVIAAAAAYILRTNRVGPRPTGRRAAVQAA